MGENVLAVHVYYQGLVNRAYNSGDYRQGLITEVRADGQVIVDNCWKYAEAGEYTFTRIEGYDTQFDEQIDNRKKRKDSTWGLFWWRDMRTFVSAHAAAFCLFDKWAPNPANYLC